VRDKGHPENLNIDFQAIFRKLDRNPLNQINNQQHAKEKSFKQNE